MQGKKIRPIPIILFGPEYWTRIINFEALVEEGTISADDLRLFQYVETADQAWDIITHLNNVS